MLGRSKSQNKEQQSNGVNEETSKKQKMLIVVIIAIMASLGFIIHLANQEPDTNSRLSPGSASRLKDAVSRNPSDNETIASLNDQINNNASANATIKKELSEQKSSLSSIQNTLSELVKTSNAEQNSSSEYETLFAEIEFLKRELNKKQSLGSQTIGNSNLPLTTVGRGDSNQILSPQTRGFVSGSETRNALEDAKTRTVKIIELGAETLEGATQTFDKVVKGDLSSEAEPKVFNTQDYVPPNAFASATILVGVDAATSEASQNDPQAATFLITGPARHVVKDGVMQTTDLEGCIVNGAAYGELSTERVHIKLQMMSCPLEGGDVAVQQVQGHVTELGKAGVRGQVIERQGDKVRRATIAGALEGLGGALGSVGGRGYGIGGGGGLVQEIPNAEELAIASAGGAVKAASSNIADFYLERARAYEPVVAMPRGINVELVFISGFKARPTQVAE